MQAARRPQAGLARSTYSLAGTPPTGLSLNTSTGAVAGMPTAVGTSWFSVTASDAYGDSNSQSYSIGVSIPDASPIKHIVVIMQENRTFDNLFNGFPGADSAQSGMSKGTVVPLSPVPLAGTYILDNSHRSWWKAWDNGQMDGFTQNFAGIGTPPRIPTPTCSQAIFNRTGPGNPIYPRGQNVPIGCRPQLRRASVLDRRPIR